MKIRLDTNVFDIEKKNHEALENGVWSCPNMQIRSKCQKFNEQFSLRLSKSREDLAEIANWVSAPQKNFAAPKQKWTVVLKLHNRSAYVLFD
mgnify:CR=1 FL=1